MADVKVEKRTPEREKERERGIARWMEPREFAGFNPFSLMRRLSDEMDRAFASSFGLWPGGATTTEAAVWSPPVEVFERGNDLVVRAELPGLTKDDVKVELTADGLLIQGEKKREHEEQKEGFYRSERSYGRFSRLIPMPQEIDTEKVNAQFKDGVLEVTTPIPESMRRKHREIPIKG